MGILGVYVLASKAKNGTRAVYSENYEYIETSLKQLRKKNYGEKTWNGLPSQLEFPLLLLIHILSTFWSFYPQMLLAWVFPLNFVLHTPKEVSEQWCFDGFKQSRSAKRKESGDCQTQKEVERTLIMCAVVHALGHGDNMAWLIPVSLETPRPRHLVYS